MISPVISDTSPDLPAARCAALLEEIGFLGNRAIHSAKALAGGISSDIFLVELADRRICIKFANERLRTAATWLAPVRRSLAEFRWLEFVASRYPSAVPQLFGYGANSAGFAMEYLPPESHANWKSELLLGRVSAEFAALTGRRLASIHSLSSADAELPSRFENQQDFESLRLEPYFRFTAQRHCSVAAALGQIADDLARRQHALVHGDVSPKNILVGARGPVFLDAECAVFGDPAFDVAFFLNHLLLKAACFERNRAALLQAFDAFWNAYRSGVDWEDAASLEQRTALILPALMLARVDGKSPLEYLTAECAAAIRRIALGALERRFEIVEEVKAEMQRRLQ